MHDETCNIIENTVISKYMGFDMWASWRVLTSSLSV